MVKRFPWFIAFPDVSRRHLLVLLPAALFFGCTVAAEAAKAPMPDKSGYNLFTATPKELMRELSPDRPDKTESPYTVDAGHLQVEMSFIMFTRNKSERVRTTTWNVAPVSLKAGLSNTIDLELLLDNYLQVHTDDSTAQTTTRQSGFGDTTIRIKANFWGNDGGATAFGILPFVKFPTNTNDLGNNNLEGGVILPLAVKLPGGWDLGVESAPLFMHNSESAGYHAEVIDTITVHHDLIGNLEGYLEFFSNVSWERGSHWVGTADLGLIYQLTDNLQVDCGVNLGVTRAADDLSAFTGITMRY